MGTIDISIGSLLAGLLLMIIPVYFLWKYRTGMVKSTITALARMVGQLFLVGLYLKYLFLWDNPFLNVVWVIIMVFVATETALTRTKLKRSIMMCPIMVGFVTGAILVGFYFLGIVLELNNVFSVQYFIPVLGILMGNMLGVNVIALNTFYSHLRRESTYYYFMLGNGATVQEAVSPFVKQALVRAFSPAIANMAVMGLVALPGTMIGQILGGSTPDVAIKYQMMIIVITTSASMLSIAVTLYLVRRLAFDVDALRERRVLAVVDRALGEAHGHDRARAELLRPMYGHVFLFTGRDDAVDEAERERFLGAHLTPAPDQLLGACRPDQSRQPLGGTTTGNDAEQDLGLAEPRGLPRDA
jgi:putative ABC transport system permease protein